MALVMARLWFLHSSLSLIAGMFLILSGLGRFVEESYRGEPQTPLKAGLRIYQWMAITSVLAGIFVTMISNTPYAPAPQMNWESIIAAAAFGLWTCFALGVDFPESNKRFTRLA
jgi:prolipoprotein diacylglyceryltransferase